MSGMVLVAGGTQPLGLALSEHLVEAGREVVLVGVEPSGSFPLPEGVQYARCDLTRSRNVRQLLARFSLDALVNLAFHRSPDAPRAQRLNVQTTRTLLRLAEAHGVRRFVHRSTAEVYLQRSDRPDLMREDQQLNLSVAAASWVRQRVEADVAVSTRMGLTEHTAVAVLRCAEILAPDMGSQLHDYLSSRVCLRPLGFDPVLNVLSLQDAAAAFTAAVLCDAVGPFNIPGADTLPLSKLIRRWGRDEIAVPGPLLGPLYRLRRRVRHTAFDYDSNRWRFHYNGILDGHRAGQVLGYEPRHPLVWPGQPQAVSAP